MHTNVMVRDWKSLSWAMPADLRSLLMVSTEAQTRADERDYFRTFRSVVCIDFASFQFGLLQLRCHLGKFLVSCVLRESLRLHQLPTIQMTGRGGCFDDQIVRSSYKMLCPLLSDPYGQSSVVMPSARELSLDDT